MSAEQFITEHLHLWTSAVTSKSTRGRGSNGKIEFSGIKKLRELILELAVRGKLVKQDSKDEPASSLLARIRKKKVELIETGQLKISRKNARMSDDSESIILPNSWQWAGLVDISRKLTDGSHNPPKNAGEGFPMLSSKNVNFGNIDFASPTRYLTAADFERENARTLAEPEDILLTIVASLGRAAVVPHGSPRFALQRSVAVIRTFLNPYFLAYQLIAPSCLSYYEKHGKGTAQKGIYLGKLSTMPIAIPPLGEQDRIVQKVDELMALCDRLEQQTHDQHAAHETLVDALLDTLTQSKDADELADNWARLAGHFDMLFTTEHSLERLKQIILQLAVTGRLVKENSANEPTSSSLLEDISAEKFRLAEAQGMKTTASEQISADEKYLTVPKDWKWIRLGNTAKFIDYRGKTPVKTASGKRLITAKNVRFGHIDLVPEEFISDSDYEEWMTRGFPRYGDLLFTPEAPLGNVARVELTGEFALAQRAICFQWHEAEISRFMLIQIMAKPFQTKLVENASGMTATGIKASTLKELPIVLPSLSEQRRIVHKTNELIKLCDQLGTRLNQADQTRRQMADTVVEQAIH